MRGLISGHVLRAEVVRVGSARVSPRKTVHTLEFVSNQPVLRLRERDELAWLEDPRLKLQVLVIARVGADTVVTVRVVGGMRAPGIPTVGQVLECAERVPNWGRLAWERKHLSAVLAHSPWTHDTRGIPTVTRRAAPADPLAAVEAYR
jgi:hypothetical protein